MITQQALKLATPSMRELAEETGLTYATMKAWRGGHRRPSAEAIRVLSRALRKRAARLQAIAERLDREAEG